MRAGWSISQHVEQALCRVLVVIEALMPGRRLVAVAIKRSHHSCIYFCVYGAKCLLSAWLSEPVIRRRHRPGPNSLLASHLVKPHSPICGIQLLCRQPCTAYSKGYYILLRTPINVYIQSGLNNIIPILIHLFNAVYMAQSNKN